jgi:endonuclease YncB( thermonuclease family)
MARIVRFAQIADERLRDRDFDNGGRRGILNGVRLLSLETLAVLVTFVSLAYIAASLLPSGAFDTFVEQPGRELNLLRTADIRQAHFQICTDAQRVTCVVDGDTIWLEGVKIRLADIDTPEISQPSCPEELALGQKATTRMAVLLNAGPFEVEPYERDEDVYGRKLRILSRNGTSLGARLVEEGLAHVWDGQKHSWCG